MEVILSLMNQSQKIFFEGTGTRFFDKNCWRGKV